VWSGLPTEIASELLAAAKPLSLRAGDALFEAGDKGDGCYRLDKGVLKVSLASPQGGERIITILSQGAIVGDLAVIDGLPRSAWVVGLTDCELRFISRETFDAFATRHPEIHEFLVRLLARRLRETDDTIAALAFLTAKGRVAYALLELAESLGEKSNSGAITIPQMISQKDLAALAGVARENTNRILRNWQQQKLIVRSNRSYRIEDVKKLEREVDWEE
jgi:CRP/FNR family transcriptional regulator